MEDDGAERRTAHARVGDPEHVLHTRPCQLGGNGQVSRFGHPGADRPGILQHERIVGMNIEVGIVDAGREISRPLKTTARPTCSKRRSSAAAHLMIDPLGARLPNRASSPPVR